MMKQAMTYLALGDSYTIGELVAYKDSFPHKTVRMLSDAGIAIECSRVIATTGWTTDELAKAIDEAEIDTTFDIVSLLIGVNNQYRGRSIDVFKTEFEHLLKKAIKFCKHQEKGVWVLSIPDWGMTPFAAGKDQENISAQIDSFNAVKKEACKQYQVPFIDITSSTRNHAQNPEFLASDLLHPSALEYQIWARLLCAEIQDRLKGYQL